SVNVLSNCCDVMHSVVEPHRWQDFGNRLRPHGCLNFRLVAIASQHFRRRYAMNSSNRFRWFVPSPPGTARRELYNRSVGIADVETREIMSVEWTVNCNSQID